MTTDAADAEAMWKQIKKQQLKATTVKIFSNERQLLKLKRFDGKQSKEANEQSRNFISYKVAHVSGRKWKMVQGNTILCHDI